MFPLDNKEPYIRATGYRSTLGEEFEKIDDLLDPTASKGTDYAETIVTQDALPIPPEDLKIKFECYQSGSGTPSLDNVRPITGHSEVKVTRAGKNLLDITAYSHLDGFSLNNGVLTNTVTDSASSLRPKIMLYDSTTLTSDHLIGDWQMGYITSNGKYSVDINVPSNAKTLVFKHNGASRNFQWDGPVAAYGNLKFSFEVQGYNCQTVGGTVIKNVMISVEDVSYEPYMGEVFTIDLDGTRYGGTLDVDAGTLTIDRVYEEHTIASIYQRSENANCDFALFTVTETLPSNIYTSTQVILDKGRYYNNATETFDNISQNGVVFVYSLNNKTLAISVPKGASLADAQAMFGTIGIIYPLATPQTITLSPTIIKLLKGYNTIYANAGELTITYNPEGTIGGITGALGTLTDSVQIVNDAVESVNEAVQDLDEDKISLSVLKSVTADSADFAAFKAAIAAL